MATRALKHPKARRHVLQPLGDGFSLIMKERGGGKRPRKLLIYFAAEDIDRMTDAQIKHNVFQACEREFGE